MNKIRILSLVVLIVAVGAAVLHAQQSRRSGSSELPRPQSRYDTSEWLEYSDGKIGFRYPSDWRVETAHYQVEGQPRVSIQLFDTKQEFVIDGSAPLGPTYIEYHSDVHGGDVNKLITDERARSRIQNETTKIGGHKAYVLKGRRSLGVADDRIVFANDMVYSFSNRAPNIAAEDQSEKELNDIFETVLSTVQFR